MKLAIVSHTEHFRDAHGKIVGWGPTVREINYLAKQFEYIYHIGCLYASSAPNSSIPYTEKNVEFVPLPPFGGKKLINKISVLTTAFPIIRTINKIKNKVGAIQLRLPTGMGNYLLPYLTLNRPAASIWVKYAGNWNATDVPPGYRFQRWWLKKNYLQCPVTINGKWRDQPKHCISLENPCISAEEQSRGRVLIPTKSFNAPLTAVFVGRLEKSKGVDRIIEAIPALYKKGVRTLHFIGGGDKLDHYRAEAGRISMGMNVCFHGFTSRDRISEVLIASHLLLLPSDNEGFPKVIAEGANYGCVPVVSSISSIPHYINDKNGFLWSIENISFRTFVETLDLSSENLSAKSRCVFEVSKLFTFERNNQNILTLLKDITAQVPEI